MKGKYNTNIHATLLAAVGGYVLYLAWTLFEKYRDKTEEMPPALNLLAIIVFAAGGLGTLYYAWTIYRNGEKSKTEKEDDENDGKEPDNK